MASALAHIPSLLKNPNFQIKQHFSFTHQILIYNSTNPTVRTTQTSSFSSSIIICSATNKSSEISSTAKIRSEVLSPFRTVRMFFYLAFMASGGLGGLISTTQLIAALTVPNSPNAGNVGEILKSVGIDFGAVSLFAFLYYNENNSKNAQLARLSREESLSNLKLRVDENRVISVGSLRGIARLVVVAGPGDFISECFRSSQQYADELMDRGVLVVPFVTDGNMPVLEFDGSEVEGKMVAIVKRKRLWQLVPVFPFEWTSWLDEQKKLANVAPEAPVYISLRLDGRVRGSGVGSPSWNILTAQLPPVKGLWSGLLDGFDGKV
ncbi:hypothetical protein GIB67_024575 [Kingdonia uniflora]|uniref:Protein LOW PSII ACCUMULATION 1, chloroplastic n=1 Tax=Kingdonia uniflora TaxID=39325 RepID=A0A7J7LP80_9MAGN|nr:hypothetical protein GIB67_024575 [Kingdonia uniflora]